MDQYNWFKSNETFIYMIAHQIIELIRLNLYNNNNDSNDQPSNINFLNFLITR